MEYTDQSFEITKNQFNYLLPIYGNQATKQLLQKIDRKIDKFYFIGTYYQYLDLLNRCKYLND
jgi:hypothetical protein